MGRQPSPCLTPTETPATLCGQGAFNTRPLGDWGRKEGRNLGREEVSAFSSEVFTTYCNIWIFIRDVILLIIKFLTITIKKLVYS